ncbi:hypothetical protein G6F59_016952 [Rhizopus arrhizus]|nr:hypothetical protein G6F59_016952 [Rhizopus arrhizus]
MTRSQALRRLEDGFAARGWRAWPVQRARWRHYLAGESGVLHTPTGSGKTLAMFGGPLLQAMIDPPVSPRRATTPRAPFRRWATGSAWDGGWACAAGMPATASGDRRARAASTCW